MTESCPVAFERVEYTIPISKIIPQRVISQRDRRRARFKMIACSLKATGLIEALVVHPASSGMFLLLDGHSRLELLRELGETEVRCTIATDDEAYTYNKRVNAVSNVEQHFMLQKALDHGISEQRLSQALGLSARKVRVRRDLLDGICPEAVKLLRTRKVSLGVFGVLRRIKPVRQVEVIQDMIASGSYTAEFARSLLAETRRELLVKPARGPMPKAVRDHSSTQAMLSLEAERLSKDLKTIEVSYGKNVLALTVYLAYIKRVLANSQVTSYLLQFYPGVLEVLKAASSDQLVRL